MLCAKARRELTLAALRAVDVGSEVDRACDDPAGRKISPVLTIQGKRGSALARILEKEPDREHATATMRLGVAQEDSAACPASISLLSSYEVRSGTYPSEAQ